MYDRDVVTSMKLREVNDAGRLRKMDIKQMPVLLRFHRYQFPARYSSGRRPITVKPEKIHLTLQPPLNMDLLTAAVTLTVLR